MKFEIFSMLLTMFAAASAHALTDVCTLANTELPGSIRVSSSELSSYKEKMKAECALSEKYQQMQLKGMKFGISLEEINAYQAPRYVDRGYYDSAKMGETPIPLIYKLLNADGKQDSSQSLRVVWDNFAAGIKQMDGERARLLAGGRLTLSDLDRLHRGFYTLSDECYHPDGITEPKNPKLCSKYSHFPYPGVRRAPQTNDGHWWILKPEEVARTKAIVDDVNETFAAWGFMKTGLAGLYGDSYQNEIISVRAIDATSTGIFEGDSRANLVHLETMLDFINTTLGQTRAGQHMVWNKRLVTPLQAALLIQQLFVDIHPYNEGNGRTSRLLQELILTSFALPHGASGDLMSDDVLTRQEEYYARGMSATQAQLAVVDSCFENAYVQQAIASGGAKGGRNAKGAKSSVSVASPVNVTTMDPSKLDYNCRLIR